jgi:hypothetical protein
LLEAVVAGVMIIAPAQGVELMVLQVMDQIPVVLERNPQVVRGVIPKAELLPVLLCKGVSLDQQATLVGAVAGAEVTGAGDLVITAIARLVIREEVGDQPITTQF